MAGENPGSRNRETDLFAADGWEGLVVPLSLLQTRPPGVKGKQVMTPDALPPTAYASRSLLSFVHELDGYDPEDGLSEGYEETKGFEPEIVAKYLRCVRGFLTSARARIIEAQLPAVKEQL